jgi:hypothetical protein
MKRSVEIEKLLHWAFRDELPKRQTSAAEGIWDRLQQYGYLGGVDGDPGHGAAQRYAHFGLPHPDAEKIEKAVAALPDLVIDWAVEAETILGDLIGLVDPRPKPRRDTTIVYNDKHRDKLGRRSEKVRPIPAAPRDVMLVRSFRTATLVAVHATKATQPDLISEQPRPQLVTPAHGMKSRAMILGGECRGKDLYTTGTYCPVRWSPSPTSIAIDRGDYLAWWRGLARLAGTLKLDAHEALPPAAPEYPWLTPRTEPAVFLEDEASREKLPLAPQRDRAMRPDRRRSREVLTMKHLGRE